MSLPSIFIKLSYNSQYDSHLDHLRGQQGKSAYILSCQKPNSKDSASESRWLIKALQRAALGLDLLLLLAGAYGKNHFIISTYHKAHCNRNAECLATMTQPESVLWHVLLRTNWVVCSHVECACEILSHSLSLCYSLLSYFSSLKSRINLSVVHIV